MSFFLIAASITTLIAIYGIAALALNLQFGYGGMINFGAAAFFAVGAYGYALSVLPPADGTYTYLAGWDLPIPIGVIIGGVAAMILALIIGLPTLRLTGEYLAVVTFALAEMIRQLFINEPAIGNGTRGLFDIPLPGIELVPGREYTFLLAGIVLVGLLITWLVMRHVTRSPFGRSLLATRENPVVAESIGKHTYGLRLRAFVFSSFFLGVSGAFYVWYLSILDPGAFSVNITFTIWIAIIIGGVSSNSGAVLGTVVLLTLRESLTYVKIDAIAPETLSALQDALQGLVLILILLFWRRGLLPRRARRYEEPPATPSAAPAPATSVPVGGHV
jgi:branched-chain amino acid transport system permease protein